MQEKREHWGSSWGFLMAAIGSAIGLGNIWKFPYVTGMNGGGAFVLVYLVCIAVIGLPVMICEISMGRATQKNPLGAFLELSPRHSRLAEFLGGVIVLIGLTLLVFQSYGYGALLVFTADTAVSLRLLAGTGDPASLSLRELLPGRRPPVTAPAVCAPATGTRPHRPSPGPPRSGSHGADRGTASAPRPGHRPGGRPSPCPPPDRPPRR